MGSAAAGRAARVVLFAFVVVNALRVVVVDCVDDLQGIESFKTRPGSMSESSALGRYDIFRDFACCKGYFSICFSRHFLLTPFLTLLIRNWGPDHFAGRVPQTVSWICTNERSTQKCGRDPNFL